MHGAMRAVVMVACGGLMAGGCSTAGPPMFGTVGFGATTVAFESIDGPPETVFKKLVLRLTDEASTRRVAVVSRDDAAQYRIRGYVSAHVQGRRTTLAWVWDIYDADRQRTLRLAGEVAGASSERAWAAADDQAIGRMAHDGIERLASFLTAPGEEVQQPSPPPELPGLPGPPAPPPDQAGPAVAVAPSAQGTLAYLPAPPH
jgi:hypothetical protein